MSSMNYYYRILTLVATLSILFFTSFAGAQFYFQQPYTINSFGTSFLFNPFSFNPVVNYLSFIGNGGPFGINTGFSGPTNPYVAAATYYAAALLPADIVGAWSGTWTSTSTLISVSGDVSLTMVQATNDVAGTLLFLYGGVVKLGCPIIGVIDADLLTITGSGTLAGKAPIPYEVVLSAAVVGNVMEGEYVITETLLGNVIEKGTFSASRL